MPNRLPLDANLIGYWGFDEALETDSAIDASASLADLTVTASPSTQLGRVGNARQFDGSSTFATPIGSSAAYQLTGDMAIIIWAKLDSFNSSGSLNRTLISCSTTPTAFDDTFMWGLYVSSDGRLNYRHESTVVPGEVRVRTPVGTIKTGQAYNIAMRRFASGGGQEIELFIDNVQVATEVLVQGIPSSFPVPAPSTNASNTLYVGGSPRFTDGGFWHGWIDEASVHDVARQYHAYLIAAYYRAALRATSTKLTATDNVLSISSYEMGSGVRWWCVERDRDLYVVKESPFGNFGPETRLTTPGGGNSSNTGKPELIYDSATDTLYVFFVAGNRIYKLTANSTDDPATINMPFTADTGGIIKSLENTEGGRFGDGSGQRDPRPDEDIVYVNRQPVKLNFVDPDTATNGFGEGSGAQESFTVGSPNAVSISFTERPSPEGFGLLIGPNDAEEGGYIAYRLDGGIATVLTTPVELYFGGPFFTSITTRVYGRGYFAQALDKKGRPSGIFSPVIVDHFNEGVLVADTRWDFGRDGDLTDSGVLGDGSSQRDPRPDDITYVNRTPVKFSTQDPDTNLLGEGSGGAENSGGAGTWTQAGTTRII